MLFQNLLVPSKQKNIAWTYISNEDFFYLIQVTKLVSIVPPYNGREYIPLLIR